VRSNHLSYRPSLRLNGHEWPQAAESQLRLINAKHQPVGLASFALIFQR
jgi:hypothetical protein